MRSRPFQSAIQAACACCLPRRGFLAGAAAGAAATRLGGKVLDRRETGRGRGDVSPAEAVGDAAGLAAGAAEPFDGTPRNGPNNGNDLAITRDRLGAPSDAASVHDLH